MEVHPGITTLASCIVIAFMLGIYLSMGTINSFINRIRQRFTSGRRLSRRRDTDQLEMTLATEQQIGKEAVLVKSNHTEVVRNETTTSSETLSGVGKSNPATEICNSVETGRDRCDTKASVESPIITSATLICAQLYTNTKSLVNDTSKCSLAADDVNLSKEVEIPLIAAC